jgi:hypothetical protein
MLRAATTVLFNVNEGNYINRYRVLFKFPAVPINSAVSTEFIYIPYSVPILEEVKPSTVTPVLRKVYEGH